MADSGAEEYKNKGNSAFKEGNWDEAIKNYNKAIQLDPNQAPFYSNRAACWSSKGNHDSALSDAKKCIEADPNFIKGYSRKGKALSDMGNFDEAEAAFKEGLDVDPNNDICTKGVADVQRARAATRARSSGGGGGGGGGMFGNLGGMGKKIMESMGGGRGGRMQMYAVIAMGYFMYNSYNKGSRSSSSSSSSGHDVASDSHSAASPGRLRRNFVDVDGEWLSYVESGGRGDSMVLFLHRTSLSAEGEYGAVIGRVLEKASSPPPGGIRVFAPDRPCHGFSPCSSSKAGGSGSWLDGILMKRPKAKKLTIVASGRAAAQQAIALAHERAQAVQLLLLSPSAGAPSRDGLADPMADSAELQKWLAQQQGSGVVTAGAAADAAHWAVTAAEDSEDEEGEKSALTFAGLPEGSEVTTLYSDGEKEDRDLKEELEGLGISIKVLRAQGNDAVLDALVTESWRMATGEPSAEDVVQEE